MTDRSHSKPLALCVALFTLVALAVPFAGIATANHPSSSCLDVEPETADNPVGSLHTLTATLYSIETAPPTVTCENSASSGGPGDPAVVTSPSGVNIDFEVTGPNDPDDSDSPATPDLTCTILFNQSSCTDSYQGLVTGDDTIRGWIDHDGTDESTGGETEADPLEEQDSTTGPGTGCPGLGTGGAPTPPEPDCTDVVTKTWTAGPPAAVDCDDQSGPDTERETNPSQAGGNSNENYTCTVTDSDGNPTDNRDVTVFGEVENNVNDPDAEGSEGPSYDSPDYRCQTNDGADDGICTITVGQVDGEVGTAEICFWIEEQGPDDFTFASDENPDEGGDAQHCGGESTGEAQAPDGSDEGNDEADQVEKTWEARRAASVDAEPESDTNEPGQTHRITAHVFDQFGGTFTGSTTVHFEWFQGSPGEPNADGNNSPASPDRSCTTQNTNSCFTEYTSQQPGLDRICVFIGSAPSMSGDNTNGTCDGEGLVDEDDEPGEADPPEGIDDQDVVQKRWGAAGTAQRLDCDPETDTNPTGTAHTITCTARDSSNQPVQNANVDAEATGANDPDNADSQDSPDFTCTTNAQGQCTFTHGSGGQGTSNDPGQTTYRAWIDSDNDDATMEADTAEGQAEATTPGSEGEPDNTDVVTKNWTGDARRIDCEPENATNNTGTTHTVTCTVTDRGGSTVSGEQVNFTESGVGEIQGSATDTTDQNGQATVTTTSSEAGEQTITGTLNDDETGSEPGEVDECDRAANDPQGAPAGECSDSVTKTWEVGPEPQCSDGIDNDGDGLIDHPDDPGCASPEDNDESNVNVVEGGPCQGFEEGSRTPKAGGGEVIVGTSAPDALVGTEGDDTICGLGGDDVIDAAGGEDQVVGNAGNDTIDGGGDRDQLNGGGGDDSISGRAGNDVINGRGGDDTLKGNKGRDTIKGHGGNDIIQGGAGVDTAVGGRGRDTIRGWTEGDVLRGGGGNDLLIGNAGPDFLHGGAGRDTCRGGPGRDTFRSCERRRQ